MPLRLLCLMLLSLCVEACVFGGKAQSPPPRSSPVTLETTLDGQALEAEATSSAIVKLVVRPRPADPARDAPVNVALVIDTSGSMEGKPLEDARTAARTLLHSLSDGNRLAVVAFGTEALVLQPSTELDRSSRAAIEQKLTEMRARGTTDLAAGLGQGLEQVTQAFAPDGINRVVLLGDGIPKP